MVFFATTSLLQYNVVCYWSYLGDDSSNRCAVIVNDMAALNIDKSLIDQSALVQTDGKKGTYSRVPKVRHDRKEI